MRRALLLSLALALAFDFDDEEDVAVDSASPAFFTGDAMGSSCTLEHSLGGKDFSVRGKLFYNNFASVVANGGHVNARASQAKLSGDELDAILALAKAGGYYTLRLPSKLDDPSSPRVSTSVSACALVASRFQEQLQLSMSETGRLLALSYVVPTVPPTCAGAAMPRVPLDEVLFNTSVSMHFPEEGPKPVGKIHEAAFLPPAAAAAARAASSADGKEGAEEPQPPQSFLRKYWMYILPAVLMLTFGGDGGAAEGEKGGEGGDAAASGAAKPAAASARRRN